MKSSSSTKRTVVRFIDLPTPTGDPRSSGWLLCRESASTRVVAPETPVLGGGRGRRAPLHREQLAGVGHGARVGSAPVPAEPEPCSVPTVFRHCAACGTDSGPG